MSDRTAFADLALPHLPALYRLARRLTRGSADAEDLVQETYLKALRNFARLRDRTRMKAWLCRIMTNNYLDHYRRRQEAPELVDIGELESFSLYQKIWDEDPLPYSDHLHDDFLAQFTDEDVRSALDNLPDSYRLPVVLAYVEDFSYRELARMLGCPMGTVMSRLHRGRRLLERELWEVARRRGYVQGGKIPT